jgi:RNA polymerase sigma-54 factor
MKTSLRTSLHQHLTLTPQLRQAIRLLQLSSIDLEAEVSAALEANPMLERVEDGGDAAADTPEQVDGSESPLDPELAAEDSSPEPADLSDWPVRHGGDGMNEETSDGDEEDLRDHLLWQLHLSTLSPRDRRIGATLIEAIDDDGYLHESMVAIQDALRPGLHADEAEILAVLHRVQRFDPVGAGARNLAECLDVQLSMLSEDTPYLELARTLTHGHLEELAKLGPERLAAHMHVLPEDMDGAVALIRSLDPRPGRQVAPNDAQYIAPDCVVWRQGGLWRAALANGSQPRLAINRHYERLLAQASRDDATYLRSQLQEARWLLKSLESRSDTLLRVAQCIVRQQSGFLEHGPEAMRPLTLRDVAEDLGMHESTVSRATARKFMRTPRGTFEFRHFFASGVATVDGGAASSTAIQAMIRKLIEDEDPRHPLSDARMAAELKATGIPVARRTVAKYRETMNIPASNDRQRLG